MPNYQQYETDAGRWQVPVELYTDMEAYVELVFGPINLDDYAKHIANAHVLQPAVLANMGLEYDAELAYVHGAKLQGVADDLSAILAALTGGVETFADTVYAEDIIKFYPGQHYNQHIPADNTLANYLNSTHYHQNVAQELSRLVQLGLANTGAFPAAVTDQLVLGAPLPTHTGESLIRYLRLVRVTE